MPRKKVKSRKIAPKPKKPDLAAILSQQLRDVESRVQEALKQLQQKTGQFLDRVEFESRIGELQSTVLESIPKVEAAMRSIESKLTRTVQKPELETRLAEVEQRIVSLAAEIEALKGRVKDVEVPEV
jgi:DNA repair ATPase RecN